VSALRNAFFRSCVKRSSKVRSFNCYITVEWLPKCMRFSTSHADVDAALEEGSIFDADAGGGDVACEDTFGTNVDAAGSQDIARELTENNDLAGADASRDIAVFAHGNAVAGNANTALDFAVDEQRFSAGDLTSDGE